MNKDNNEIDFSIINALFTACKPRGMEDWEIVGIADDVYKRLGLQVPEFWEEWREIEDASEEEVEKYEEFLDSGETIESYTRNTSYYRG